MMVIQITVVQVQHRYETGVTYISRAGSSGEFTEIQLSQLTQAILIQPRYKNFKIYTL